MRTARCLALLTLSLCLSTGPGRARAGTIGPDSDDLFRVIVGVPGNPVLDFGTLPESPPGVPEVRTFDIPALTINFLEAAGTPIISDQLHINPFTATITSDPPPIVDDQQISLPPRPGATQVPSNELVTVFGAVAVSDGNPTPSGKISDSIQLLRPNGAGPVAILPEGSMPQAYQIGEPARFWDILEPGSSTLVSDYIDVGPITGYFLSDTNETTGLTGLPPADYSLVESSSQGGSVAFGIFLNSEAVPEPSSIVVAGTAVLVGLGYAWRRKRIAA